MKKALIAVAVASAIGGPAMASNAGVGQGGGVVPSSLPFPLTPGLMACYDSAMQSGQEVDRYADWNGRSPAACQTRWEDVPDDRRRSI